MTRAPEQTVEPPSPGDDANDYEYDRHLEFNGRTVLTLCGFLGAAILALYLLLPQLAGLEDTWRRIEDGSPYWMLVALLFGCGMFFGYVAMFRGIFLRGTGIEAIWKDVAALGAFAIVLITLSATRFRKSLD